jgi:Histidine kinase-, DNA gyrase B-, and HSP90-like ATPase/Response regulator receiver domain
VPGSLGELLASGRDAHDEIHLTGEAVVVVNQAPVTRQGRAFGTVATLRDHTELQALTGELDSVRGLAESLKSQAHESANRLHAVVALIELGRPDAAVEFATAELAAAQRLADQLLAVVEEPVLVALLLGKAAEATERGVELVVSDDTAVKATLIDPRDLVTAVGNLIDNAIDAALAAPPPRRVTVTVRQDEAELLVRVADTGAGLDPAGLDQAFTRGWSTKPAGRPHGRGLGAGPGPPGRHPPRRQRRGRQRRRRGVHHPPAAARLGGAQDLSTAIRVLVVEDDPVLAGAHRELVGRVAGFECIGVAHSGAEALRFLAAREVDLVLLDQDLPGASPAVQGGVSPAGPGCVAGGCTA